MPCSAVLCKANNRATDNVDLTPSLQVASAQTLQTFQDGILDHGFLFLPEVHVENRVFFAFLAQFSGVFTSLTQDTYLSTYLSSFSLGRITSPLFLGSPNEIIIHSSETEIAPII
jgi:hypothetical protein